MSKINIENKWVWRQDCQNSIEITCNGDAMCTIQTDEDNISFVEIRRAKEICRRMNTTRPSRRNRSINNNQKHGG